MDDITYKLKKIKFHRLVFQIERDITNHLYKYSNETLEEILQKKYPGVKVDMNYGKDFAYNIYVSIPRPTEKICVKLTVTPTGAKIE